LTLERVHLNFPRLTTARAPSVDWFCNCCKKATPSLLVASKILKEHLEDHSPKVIIVYSSVSFEIIASVEHKQPRLCQLEMKFNGDIEKAAEVNAENGNGLLQLKRPLCSSTKFTPFSLSMNFSIIYLILSNQKSLLKTLKLYSGHD
jgi:hypothetical protein